MTSDLKQKSAKVFKEHFCTQLGNLVGVAHKMVKIAFKGQEELRND
jgi:hypothetical protein